MNIVTSSGGENPKDRQSQVGRNDISKDIKQFIRENAALFWGVKPDELENISLNVLVETILNFGNEKKVRTLFDLIGIKTVAEIFFRQISGKRSNYHQRTKHFFRLYFKRHAQ